MTIELEPHVPAFAVRKADTMTAKISQHIADMELTLSEEKAVEDLASMLAEYTASLQAAKSASESLENMIDEAEAHVADISGGM